MKNRYKIASKRDTRAFTLVEMLVVLLIVSVLMGVGAQVMKNATTAQGVGTAVPLAESMFAQARALAKGSGVGTRVVIYNDGGKGEDRKKHLRYIGVVRQKVNDGGTPGDPSDDSLEWSNQLTGRGTTLPSKTYFNENLSGDIPTTSVLIPGMKGPKSCFYYEFNAEGILVEPKSTGKNEPTAVFVIQAGKLLPTDETPRELSSGNREAGGFAVWKRGNTTLFRSVDEIPSLSAGQDPKFK